MMAVGIDRSVLAGGAERETGQRRQYFDDSQRDHDGGGNRKRPNIRRQQDVAYGTHCCDLILSSLAAISFSRCRRSSSSSSLAPSTLEAGTPVTRLIAAMARSALTVLVAEGPRLVSVNAC